MNPKKVLIIGIQGALARMTAEILIKNNPDISIHGVDSRNIEDLPIRSQLTAQQMRYNRTNFEKLFREHDFESVLHLGRLGHSPAMGNTHKRIDINLVGTNTILDLAQKFNAKKVVILSTHHVYGALPDNPMFLKEDSPLRASFNMLNSGMWSRWIRCAPTGCGKIKTKFRLLFFVLQTLSGRK